MAARGTLIGLLLGLMAGPEPPRELTLAAAADLRFALDDLAAAYRAHRPDVRLRTSYGASGVLASQALNGAPFDLLLSADADGPARLRERGLAGDTDVFLYAIGHLVLWVPRDSSLPIESGLRALAAPQARRIAIANPAHAPYGRAAEAALRSAGVLGTVRGRLVLGENAAQAAQFVQTGAADAGLLPLSLAQAPPLLAQGRFQEVPATAYPRIEQFGAVLSRARGADLARAFRDLLLGAEGRAILRRHGFGLPGE